MQDHKIIQLKIKTVRFYREMHETGAYQESLEACPPAPDRKRGGVDMSTKRGLATSESSACAD